MSLHRAVARRLRSWDVEFNLLVVSGVSTHLCQSYGDEEANEFVVVDGETPSIDVRVAIGRNQKHHLVRGFGLSKPSDDQVSDSQSDPKPALQLVDVEVTYAINRTPLCLSPYEFVRE